MRETRRSSPHEEGQMWNVREVVCICVRVVMMWPGTPKSWTPPGWQNYLVDKTTISWSAATWKSISITPKKFHSTILTGIPSEEVSVEENFTFQKKREQCSLGMGYRLFDQSCYNVEIDYLDPNQSKNLFHSIFNFWSFGRIKKFLLIFLLEFWPWKWFLKCGISSSNCLVFIHWSGHP